MVGHRSRWKTKNVFKKPFEKEPELDDIQANIKEGENTNQKTQHSKAYPVFVSKLLLFFNTSLHITFKTIRMVCLHSAFQITITNWIIFLVELCFHVVCNL